MDSKNIYICSNYSDYDFKSKRNWRSDGTFDPFVYIIEEVSTGIKYIGSRTFFKCLESDLGKKYFTSSIYVNWSKDEFKILEIIKCASNHDAIILEEILIKENNAVFGDSFYNKSHPNVGFHGSVNKGKKHSKELKKIRSNALKKARKDKKDWYKDKNTQHEISRKGGLKQGKENAKTSHLKDIATEYWRKVKSGEIEREKRIIIHNIETLKHSTIPISQEIPDGWKKSRISKKKA